MVKKKNDFTEVIPRLKFVIKSHPNGDVSGTFKLIDNTVIQRNTEYLLQSIKYNPINFGVHDSIIYYGQSNTNKSETECLLNIYHCAQSCKTCSYQNQNSSLCDTCKDEYYMTGTSPGLCLPKNSKQCHTNCLHCSIHLFRPYIVCDECKDNFFFKEDSDDYTCFSGFIPKYYLDFV